MGLFIVYYQHFLSILQFLTLISPSIRIPAQSAITRSSDLAMLTFANLNTGSMSRFTDLNPHGIQCQTTNFTFRLHYHTPIA
jgi:hypothetical protein